MERVGGYQGLMEGFMISAMPDGGTGCGAPPPDALHFVRSATQSDLPWPGMVFGISISAIWYFCTDQVLLEDLLTVWALLVTSAQRIRPPPN